MDDKARRNLGAHYTSEENILKLIKPVFLDELWAKFHKVKSNKNRLFEFHKKLRLLKSSAAKRGAKWPTEQRHNVSSTRSARRHVVLFSPLPWSPSARQVDLQKQNSPLEIIRTDIK